MSDQDNSKLPTGYALDGYDLDQLSFYEWLDDEFKRQQQAANERCECGLEKTVGKAQADEQPWAHSYWCPKYRNTRENESSVDKGKKDGYDSSGWGW